MRIFRAAIVGLSPGRTSSVQRGISIPRNAATGDGAEIHDPSVPFHHRARPPGTPWLPSSWFDVKQASAQDPPGDGGRLAPVAHAQLGADGGDVAHRRPRADPQRRGDLLVRPAQASSPSTSASRRVRRTGAPVRPTRPPARGSPTGGATTGPPRSATRAAPRRRPGPAHAGVRPRIAPRDSSGRGKVQPVHRVLPIVGCGGRRLGQPPAAAGPRYRFASRRARNSACTRCCSAFAARRSAFVAFFGLGNRWTTSQTSSLPGSSTISSLRLARTSSTPGPQWIVVLAPPRLVVVGEDEVVALAAEVGVVRPAGPPARRRRAAAVAAGRCPGRPTCWGRCRRRRRRPAVEQVVPAAAGQEVGAGAAVHHVVADDSCRLPA